MDKSVYVYLQDEYARYLKSWTITQHSGWMITGSKWTDPISVALAAAGKDGKILCASMKALLQDIESGEISLGQKPNKEVTAVLKKAIKEFENKYGKVKAGYPN